MPDLNARSSAKPPPAKDQEIVHLISTLVADQARYAANHVEVKGRCRTCREVWPCIGGSIADQVIGLQQRRSG